ncbi:MAG TPA: hypothetical protein VGN17_28915 [Bryobacteraceae bacterium]|jgi:hypothetical protein
MMRRALALSACLAMIQALCLAPFQHVHADHDHASVIHAHFFPAAHVHKEQRGRAFDDVDDHVAARTLDTFTLTFAPGIAPFCLPEGSVVLTAFAAEGKPFEAIRACAHDPPSRGESIPRAPPA